eukprot:499916-Amphidinium_carterae.1
MELLVLDVIISPFGKCTEARSLEHSRKRVFITTSANRNVPQHVRQAQLMKSLHTTRWRMEPKSHLPEAQWQRNKAV